MERLVLAGAGGFARETAELVRAINDVTPTYDLAGFLDDDPTLLGTTRSGLTILGGLDWVHEHPDVKVTMCLGSPASRGLRCRVVDRLSLPEERYETLVHPTAVVPPSVRVGRGSVIHAHFVGTVDVAIGRHVEIMPGTILTHDDSIGDFVTLGAGVRLAGSVTVGADAYIGSGVTIREGLSVGPAAMVGMGAVVTRSVPAGETWMGNPARRSSGV